MKTIKFYLIILVCWSFQLQAQNEWTKEEVTKFTINFDLYEDVFEILSKSKSTNDFSIQVSSVELIDKEIIITYRSQIPVGGKSFNPSITFRLNEKELNVAPENLFGDFYQTIQFSEDIKEHQIIWTNLTENYIDLKGQLEISLSIEVFGTRQLPFDVDCGIKPISVSYTHLTLPTNREV